MSHKTVTQYSVVVPNDPGELAKVTHFLSQEGLNIEGLLSVAVGDTASIQFIADSGASVRRRLETAGLQVVENQVFHIQLSSESEEINRLTSALAEEDVNILSFYGNVGGDRVQLVLAVDHPDRAAGVMGRLGIAAARRSR